MYIDTHCHLDDKKFENVTSQVEAFKKEGVSLVINMGCDLTSSKVSEQLSSQFDEIYFACGIHPENVQRINDQVLDDIEKISRSPKCVAIGEIGLDYHFLPFDKEKQIEGFLSQIDIAFERKLPISVHCRDATQDMVNLLKDNKSKLSYGGVMHCYSGSIETCKQLLDLGFYVGFGGTVTFKNAKTVKEVCAYVPTDRILTETDSPYLSPEPFRGTLNSPKNIPFINGKIAQIKGVDNVEMANIIMNNAKNLFYRLGDKK